jgi:hypothetical protein
MLPLTGRPEFKRRYSGSPDYFTSVLLTAMCWNFFGCVGIFLKAAERARAQRELRDAKYRPQPVVVPAKAGTIIPGVAVDTNCVE